MSRFSSSSEGGGEGSSGTVYAVIDPGVLSVEELTYECNVRGLVVNEGVSKDALEQLYSDHKHSEADEVALAAFNAAEELRVLQVKVQEVRTLVADAKTRTQKQRLASLYLHCVPRVRRSMFRDKDLAHDFVSLGRKLNTVFHKIQAVCGVKAEFPKLYASSDDDSEVERAERKKQRKIEKEREAKKKEKEERERIKQEAEEKKRREEKKRKEEKNREERKNRDEHKKTNERKIKHERRDYRERKPHYTTDSSSSSSTSTSTDSSSSSSPGGARGGGSYRRRKKTYKRRRGKNPVLSWHMRYNGNRSKDLHRFLEEVEEAMDVNEVSEDELLRGVGSLLEDSAKTWHSQKRKTIGSWPAFKRQIRSAFTPEDNDEEVMEKISVIRQSSEETFAVYEARCTELFQRLNRPLAEADKLKKIFKGLHLYYKTRISSHQADSLRHLRKCCKDLEADKAQIMKQEKEERKKFDRKSDKEERRDSRYPKVSAASVVELDSDEAPAVDAVSVPVGRNALVCYICRKTGHLGIKCPTAKFCVICGAPDTTAENCQRCVQAERNNKWRRQSAPKSENVSGGSAPGVMVSPFSIPPPTIATRQKQNQDRKN